MGDSAPRNSFDKTAVSGGSSVPPAVTTTATLPTASGSGASSLTSFDFETLSIPLTDLTSDPLLRDAQRVTIGAVTVPSLGSIPLTAKLGQGGMGAVYLGFHPRLRMEVAVKVLPYHLANENPEMIQRFFREAQIAAKVKSPNLVSVIDVNEEHGLFYLVMEFVNGISAGGCIRKRKADGAEGLDESAALQICAAATAGLAAAHAAGVIHRDVKPDNILIPKDAKSELLYATAKLADLGLARGTESGPGLTVAQAVMGTPGYMSPEQATDAALAGKPADVFSMGACLYALLAGHQPFEGSGAMSIVMATINQPHKPLRELCANVTPGTLEVINRCLEKAPEKRYPDAAALLEALQPCLAPFGLARSSPTGVPVPPQKRPRRRWIAIAAILVALLAVLGFVSELKQRRVAEQNAKNADADRLAAEEKQRAAQAEQEKLEATRQRQRANVASLSNDKKKLEQALQDANSAAQRQADEQKLALRDAALAAWDLVNKATVESAHSADALHTAQAAERKAAVQSADAARESAAASDVEKKATADVQHRWVELERARATARAVPDSASRPRAKIEAIKQRLEALKPLEEVWQKSREALEAAQADARKKADAAQVATQSLTQCVAERVKCEQSVTMGAKEVTKLSDAARAAAEKYQSAAHTPLQVPTWYKLADGPCSVEVVDDLVLRDAAHDRELHCRVYHPREEGTYPLILFSAAMQTFPWERSHGVFWATHGYVFVTVQHVQSPDVARLRTKGINDPEFIAADIKYCEARVADLVLILNGFPELRRKLPAFKGKLNPITGMCGFKYGTGPALLLGGASEDVANGKPRTLADKRIGAVMVALPQGHESHGLTSASWPSMNRPLMAVLQARSPLTDTVPMPRWDTFFSFPAGDKYAAVISMSRPVAHDQTDEDDPGSIDASKASSIAFWDAYLKSDAKAKSWLQTDMLAKLSKNRSRIIAR